MARARRARQLANLFGRLLVLAQALCRLAPRARFMIWRWA
jgi:hypothetical protein